MSVDDNGDRRDRRYTDTRQRIVTTALSLFISEGFTRTSLKDIADEIGVTKAAVYYHFPAKADLAHEIFTPFVTDVEAVLARLEEGSPSRRESLTAYIDALIPHRDVFAAMARDASGLADMDLGTVSQQWIARMSALVVGAEPTDRARVRLAFALGGLTRVLYLMSVDIDTVRTQAIESALAALEADH